MQPAFRTLRADTMRSASRVRADSHALWMKDGTYSGEDDADERPEPDWEAVGNRLSKEMWEGYVGPDLQRRQDAGEWPEAEPLYRWQVLLHGETSEVRINREVRGCIAVRPRAGMIVEAGQELMVYDVDVISEYIPLPEDADVPHVTAFLHARGWSLAFEFCRRHPLRYEHMRVAREFLNAARHALDQAHLHAFADNAFSTAELLAKTELLSCAPTVELALNARRHGSVAAAYNVWARLGNTDSRFARLLNGLQKLRDPARYLVGELTLAAPEAEERMTELDAMHEHVARAIAGDDGRRHYNVIASRVIKAGTVVWTSDYTLWPARAER
jgi:hypothetical protein